MTSAAEVYAYPVLKSSVMTAVCAQTMPATLSRGAQLQTIITSVMIEMSVLHWTPAAEVCAHPVPRSPVMMVMYVQMMPATLSMDAQIQAIITSVMMEISVLHWTSAAEVYAHQALQTSVMMEMCAQM